MKHTKKTKANTKTAEIKKSKGMHHRTAFLISGICIVVVGVGMLMKNILISAIPPTPFASATTYVDDSTPQPKTSQVSPKIPTLVFPDDTYTLDVSDTNAKRVQGLSSRTSLGDHEAMLFVFDSSDFWGFWMKDMKFNLDIIWLDENYKVITVKENLSPGTYPEVYKPSSPALYVLEATTGFAAAHSIKTGTKLDIRK